MAWVLGWVLLSGVLPAAAADPIEQSSPSAGASIDALYDEDPRFSELAKRDPALVAWLRSHPDQAGRLSAGPTLIESAVQAMRNPWVLFGFAAQFVFMLRFIVQWVSSERKQRSHVPTVFWYLSIGGGLMLLAYAIYRRDPVFMFGQGLGLLIYFRNLVLIYRRAWAYQEVVAERSRRSPAAAALADPTVPSSEPSAI
jgi:lipid-A-disaccharide synthase-like uncharacterized protein